MNALTIIYPYYREPELLAHHVRLWQSLPAELAARVRVVVIDDGSPDLPALDVLRGASLPVALRLYRITEDRGWNVGGAKNLGVHVADTKWVALLDIDHELPADSIRAILDAPNLDPCTVYPLRRRRGARRLRPLPEWCIIRRARYLELGGYDEDHCTRSGCLNWGETIRRFARCGSIPGAVAVEIRRDYPDHNAALRREVNATGGRECCDVLARKAAGALPARPENPLRFGWERVL